MARRFLGIGKGTAGPASQADIQRGWDRAPAAASGAPAPLSRRDAEIQRGWDAAAERAGVTSTPAVGRAVIRAMPAPGGPPLPAGRRSDPAVVP